MSYKTLVIEVEQIHAVGFVMGSQFVDCEWLLCNTVDQFALYSGVDTYKHT